MGYHDAPAFPTPPVIDAGWLIDGTGAPPRPRCRIYLADGRIRRVTGCLTHERPAGCLPHERGKSRLDFSSATLLPGLIDAHVHLVFSGTADPEVRRRQLDYEDVAAGSVIRDHIDALARAGVVAVRDGGDHHGHVLRCWQASGGTWPVRVRTAGRAWHAPGRYGRLIGRPPEPGWSLAESIRRDLSPIHHVKIVASGLNSLETFGKTTPPQFSGPELAEAVRTATAMGRRVMVHANGPEAVGAAVAAGCHSVEHGFFMGREAMGRMAEAGTVWVPTAVTMRGYAQAAGDTRAEQSRREMARRNLDHQLDQIRRAAELGVRIALGTDAGTLGVHHGEAVRAELGLLMDGGLPVEAAVHAATAAGAELLGISDLGRIAPGMAAALVAAPGPPSDLPGSLARGVIIMPGRDRADEGGGQTTRRPDPSGRPDAGGR
jgi:imidazolonepropionase-like amidohydrolase